MTSSAVISFSAWLLLSTALNSCAAFGFGRARPIDRPAREVCILGDAGCICTDSRLAGRIPPGTSDLGQGVYLRGYKAGEGSCLNFIATNAADNDALSEWTSRNCYGPPKRPQGIE